MKRTMVAVCLSALLIGGTTGALLAAENFDNFIKPVTNPVYFDEPYNRTYVQIVNAFQSLPSHIDTILGNVPLDGNLNLTALRLNYAVNDCFSIVAAKDGYIDFNPHNTLRHESGWGDVAAGVKYAFWNKPEEEVVVSGKLLFEFNGGSKDVFQGNGDGNVSPSFSFLKGYKGFQFCGTLGGIIPYDTDAESTILYDSWHVSYGLLNSTLFPLLELNHFRVLTDGDNDDLVPSIVKFEGGDVINLGAQNASKNRDFVSMAVGARYRVIKPLDFGFAFEFPLTAKEDGLMNNRLTFDVMYHF